VDKAKLRRYGAWAGCPNGTEENVERCIAKVSLPGTMRFGQCCRNRGFGPDGLYCKQHGKMVEAGRYVSVGNLPGEQRKRY
jgi:hypothetical protein